MTPPLITLEEHYFSKPIYNLFDNSMKSLIPLWLDAPEKLFDVGDRRLRDMDSGKISLQVISHSVSLDPSPDACRAGNDQLATDIERSGTNANRFAALAVLPMGHPEAAAGVFDKFPKLKLIVGHFGEMLPFMLQRIQDREAVMGKRQRCFTQVWNENIWITTSGVWSLDPMRCILSNTKIGHILYSVDYPYTTNERGLQWIKELESSGLVTQDQLDSIAYKNACNLLRISVPSIQ